MSNLDQEAVLNALGGVKSGREHVFRNPIPVNESWSLAKIKPQVGGQLGKVIFRNGPHTLKVSGGDEYSIGNEGIIINYLKEGSLHETYQCRLQLTKTFIRGRIGSHYAPNGGLILGAIEQTTHGLSLMKTPGTSSEADALLFSRMEEFRNSLKSILAGTKDTFLDSFPGAKYFLRAMRCTTEIPVDKDSFFKERRTPAQVSGEKLAIASGQEVSPVMSTEGVAEMAFNLFPAGSVLIKHDGINLSVNCKGLGNNQAYDCTLQGKPSEEIFLARIGSTSGKASVIGFKKEEDYSDGKVEPSSRNLTNPEIKDVLIKAGEAIRLILNLARNDKGKLGNDFGFRANLAGMSNRLDYVRLPATRHDLTGVIRRLGKEPVGDAGTTKAAALS